ncbi:MAG: hypothetical protein QM756_11025 [Polyangiaceae bacterium]
MTAKKTNATINPRKARAAARKQPPTPAELERAAQALHSSLGSIVRRLEEAERDGKPVGSTWPTLRFWQAKPTRAGISPLSGVELAVIAYAERTTIENRRIFLGRIIAKSALQFVRGEIDAKQAIGTAIEWRGQLVENGRVVKRNGSKISIDEQLDASKASQAALRERVASATTEPTKWNAAYWFLAKGADVHPPTDEARACRGPRLALYTAIAATENR